MRIAFAAALCGLTLAAPAHAQAPNIGQLLQGLTTGNQGQDQALRDAFERGYQRGRQDEARIGQQQNRRAPDRRDDRRDEDRGYDQDRGGAGQYRR